MSSSESSVEMEGIVTENVSEDAESATTATENVSEDTESTTTVETSVVPSSQRLRASSDSQVSETVVPRASSNSEARNLSPVTDDVLSNQSATNAILEELELMRPTYVFSEDTVRAEGISSSYLASAIDFSSSCESDDDSDSCMSPPASRSCMRRLEHEILSGRTSSLTAIEEELEYFLFRLSEEESPRPNTVPSYRRRRRRRPPFRGIRRNYIDTTLHRI